MELTIPVGGCPLSCAGIKPAGLLQASSATQKELLLLVNGELLLPASPKVTRHGGLCVLLHDACPPCLVIHFNKSDLYWEVMIQVLVLSKKGYLIRKQTRRQICSILALYLKFFIPSCWSLGVFPLSWYEMDQGWMNLCEFVKPAWRGLCGLSAHGSPQTPFGSGHLGFWPYEWPPTQELKGRARTEHYWRHQDYCGAPGQWGQGSSFAGLSDHSFY